jgi:uncharacterized protein (TIGR03067 family)
MSRFPCVAVAVVLALFVGAVGRAGDDKEAAADKELKALEGNWQCTREEGGGRTTPELVVKGFRLIIEGNKYQTIFGGKEKGGAGTIIKIDPTANPKTIDLEWTVGGLKDQKQLGIYKLNGDKLEISWAEPSAKNRPKKFTSTPGVGAAHMYATYVREKD